MPVAVQTHRLPSNTVSRAELIPFYAAAGTETDSVLLPFYHVPVAISIDVLNRRFQSRHIKVMLEAAQKIAKCESIDPSQRLLAVQKMCDFGMKHDVYSELIKQIHSRKFSSFNIAVLKFVVEHYPDDKSQILEAIAFKLKDSTLVTMFNSKNKLNKDFAQFFLFHTLTQSHTTYQSPYFVFSSVMSPLSKLMRSNSLKDIVPQLLFANDYQLHSLNDNLNHLKFHEVREFRTTAISILNCLKKSIK